MLTHPSSQLDIERPRRVAALFNQWRPIAQQIETYLFELNDDDDEASDWHEQFLETMCRILVSLENENAFDVLRRDPDFRLCCADHDESLEDGAARMQRVRESE